ncbi:hypothetical protein CTAYLR_003763 [Chrysophaeum taylorii]|uniref:Sugar phosphate transporter domain-containing protein n=1 Tax=Chrysophaeum taylorii TaxID=2483200 RepID=A0AAD7UCY0_9STRA|nr:hypothetical protein CTAYLR_003763 [Chrysophaeum taylorii]
MVLLAVAEATTSLKPAAPPPAGLKLKGGARRATRRVEVGALVSTWYALNVLYNVQNKKVLRTVDLPWCVAVIQLLVGAAYSQAAWALGRPGPASLFKAMAASSGIAICHGAGQACTVIALGAGAVSSAHVVKALEPLFSAIVSAVVFKTVMHPLVYASLLPVVGGVALAVAKDLAFNPVSFGTAMAANLLFACRAVFSKRAMQTSPLDDLPASSLFGVVTAGAALATLPVALAIEGPHIAARLAAVPPEHKLRLALLTLSSGLFHYLNNEVMYLTLGQVHPVTLAVANTIKRIVIILASLAVLGESMAPLAAIGAAVAISGTFAYSYLKQILA